jgi:alanine-glyoxylate transaminase/serine-glyoxylate transaminase/serine-pyruvate transaminase
LIDEDELLLIPGPTTLSSRVRAAMALPQQSHVAPEFYNMFRDSLELSRYLFGNTKGLQFLFTGSGTIGMESAVLSLLEPGDKVLSIETGYFGHRFSMIAEIHGAKVDTIVTPLGKRADPDVVLKRLKSDKYKALLFTHVDTSTSVMNDVYELSKLAHENNAFSVCDSVCGVGGAPLIFDTTGADIVLTGSQKAIAGPPGATLLAVSNEAFASMQNRKTPIASYYMNLVRWKPIMDDPKIYLTTPAVQVMLGLHEALVEIKQEGIENRWARHKTLGKALQAGLEALDLKPAAEVGSRAPTVTSFNVPPGKSAEIQSALRSEYAIHLALGFGEYKDTMLRIGHFGNISSSDVLSVLGALEMVVTRSTRLTPGKAIQVAEPMLQGN